MEYQEITNLLNKTTDQPTKFRTRMWVKVSDYSNRTYKTSRQINFYTLKLKSSPCDYNDVYILVKGTITITGTVADAALQ